MPAGTIRGADYTEIQYRMSLMSGGGDGVVRGDGNDMAVAEQGTPDMTVTVDTGRGFIGNLFIRQKAIETSSTVTGPTGGAPADLRRIDLVQFTRGSGINIKAGTEDASPTAPSTDSDSIVLAHLYLVKDMASIKDADDSSNGYIVIDANKDWA
tara:strand:+ start:560 stop:1021 length:462 start_codon:yes stop_codon:yes gene_type:complete